MVVRAVGVRRERLGVVMLGELDSDELRHEESGRLVSALDAMGFGEWRREHTGGGCWVLRCDMGNGCVVMVSGDDVLSSFCDPQDFGTSVRVGFYDSEDNFLEFVGREEGRGLVGGASVETITDAVYDILAGWANW